MIVIARLLHVGSRRAARVGLRRTLVMLLSLAMVVAGMFGGGSQAMAEGAFHSPITGSGSTWSANALQAWIRNVWANYQWKITYSESGSTQGRNDFANGTADFGVSEIPYAISNSNEGDSRPARGFAYMPIVAGGTSFMYNLQIGGKQVTNLRLSGETIAKIFTGVITVWNDPAIQADNPQLALPATPIVPVVRSDGSGTSAQFTLWMRQEQTSLWNDYCNKVGRPLINGACGVTSNYPVVAGSGFVSRAGANGVAGYVAQSHAVGSITFVEYSYALNSKFPVVKMLNNAGYYVEPTAANVAVALLQAHINEDESSPDYLTQDLHDVYGDTDARTYPLSSYSYIILPTTLGYNFTEEKGLTLADFGAYFLCEGQQQAESLGYSPLPINLVQGGQKQIQKIKGGNPTIKGIGDCNNPTFTTDGTNRLANEAPYPADCDKQGPIQCSKGTGGAKDTETDTTRDTDTSSGGDGGDRTGGNGTNGNGTNGDNTSDNPDAATDAVSDGSTGSGLNNQNGAAAVVAGSPQSVPVAWTNPFLVLAMIAVGAMGVGLAVLPPLVVARRRRGAPAVDLSVDLSVLPPPAPPAPPASSPVSSSTAPASPRNGQVIPFARRYQA
ncbi:hypothetical protein GCM10009785_33980 [Brooklawnia cerclae]|uniref:Phosphate ABC transporter phosphate-binding protein n=1 Tax=Brooklawnia cerclae TaxID=349934 RepID=A0ABX0SBN0_9ACTN|nr:phosphate ABC transporter substrate-binding protein PstS [Brooklawnia cerclae]NIH55435.1 phosphate ABC transporter phosphate-binding protein [Brooklawnia cerclae]